MCLPGAVSAGDEVPHQAAGPGEPFVGRRRELHRIEATFGALARGRGHMVVVSGEAGIGKTRFCAEAADRARESGLRVVEARCWLDGGAPPLWPWHAILADLGGNRAASLLEPRAAAGAVGPDRFARFVAATDRLAEACAPAPVCLVIDDVHGADAGALLLIRLVAHSLARFPLLLVLGRRSRQPREGGEEARLLDELESEATSIALRGFDMAETTAFLGRHGHGALEPDLVATLFGLTGGHPLFLRRIVQTMGRPGAEPALQGGLRVAIEQALSGLTPGSRRVLSLAAVLGPNPLVAETAEVAGSDGVAVLEAVEEGAAAGLATPAGEGRFSFVHELVRSALEYRLTTAERLDAHARAAAVAAAADLAGPTADRLARAAHHARHAAARSADDARRAVAICETAAQAVVRNFAYEQADALFSSAIALHTSARLGPPSALLALQWAQVASLRGRLDTARRRYTIAVTRAEIEGYPALLAEAALGQGGVWLDDHPTPVDKARTLGLYRRALDGLPPDDPAYEPLRCRLTVRLAAEAAYDGGPTGPLHAAVAAALRTDDPATNAEALSLSHHALFAPEHARTRLALADELVRLTSERDQGVLSLMGLLWRTVDLFHLGDERAARALEVLRERATAVDNRHMLYNVAVADVLLLVSQGYLADAEAEAWRCHELSEEIGRADGLAYLSAQLATIRWLQGRDAEMLDGVEEVATSPTLAETEFSVWALAACLAARAGDVGRARAILSRCLPDKLADLAPSGTWAAGLMALVEAAAALDDRELAGQAYDLLLPYADLPAVAGLAIVCLGSTERTLGVAAGTLGHHDLAVGHLERAVDANRRLDNRPLLAIARADLAAALLRRGDAPAGDRDRAAELLDQAIAEGASMGLKGRVDTWDARLRSLRPALGPATATAPGGGTRDAASAGEARDGGDTSVAGDARDAGSAASAGTAAGAADTGPPAGAAGAGDAEPAVPRRGVIRRDGRRWVVALGERRIRVGNLVGMTYLADLLTHPGHDIPAVTLAGQAADPTRSRRHELLDDDARQAYAARARDLADDLAEAEAANDIHRVEQLRAELDALIEQIEAATGLNGRPRHFPDDHERARVAVQKAIKRAVDAVEDAEPTIAETLRRTISTGTTCRYSPDPRRPVTWSVAEPGRPAPPERPRDHESPDRQDRDRHPLQLQR